MSVADLCWPLARLGEGVEELARRAALRPAAGEAIVVPDEVTGEDTPALDHWLGWVGSRLGIELEPVETCVPDVGDLLAGGGPAVLRLIVPEGPRFLFLTRARAGKAWLLAPDLSLRACPLEDLRAALCARHEAPLRPAIEELLDVAKIRPARRARAGAAIARERLSTQRIGGFWMLRLPPTASFAHQLSNERAPARLLTMLGLFALLYLLEIQGWTLIGDAALVGHVDFGWLAAWVLLVLSAIPLRLAGNWIDATLAIDVGALLKLRLLLGALRSDLEGVRTLGVGQMLGRVMECQALESLAVNGGLAAIVAVMELCFAAWILALGAGGATHVALLAFWLAVTCALGWRYHRRLREWTLKRLDMTHDLVEQMVGHRTRLAQEWPERRDLQEDRGVKDYTTVSARMDAAILPFLAGVPAGWTLLGLIGLAPAFVTGGGTPVSFAIGLGGVMVANRALNGVADGLAAAARASIAWSQASDLFHAGARPATTTPYVPRKVAAGKAAPRLVDADGLTFRYEQRGAPVLDRASISIAPGERILLEGASGGGKSTLASLLAGLRRPESGLMLLNGLDRHTLGDAWHGIATEAPQFHENHIFTATLGFNLLMGRNWPASDDELKLAEDLCVELGLGDLLARMPSGMMQTVGETGWQLSHGERSRVFLARALLQDAELTILDESFAALDPETLKLCLDCAFRRARALIVIAHP